MTLRTNVDDFLVILTMNLLQVTIVYRLDKRTKGKCLSRANNDIDLDSPLFINPIF